MDAALLMDADLVEKFLREGEILERINRTAPSAPVVRVIDYGRGDGSIIGQPYVAMEFLKGHTLSKYIQGEPIPVHVALLVSTQIAEALKAAHALRVWHRDVKPENVIVLSEAPEWRIKLIDFGVARDEDTSGRTVGILGTPHYMAPEQFSADDISDRTDIYSLGVLIYTLLSGKPPFSHRNPASVMEMHRSKPVPALPPFVPSQVSALTLELLAKRPQDRPDIHSVITRLRTASAAWKS